jgi:GntR family transcriptional regulator/MocR family aminotransferase
MTEPLRLELDRSAKTPLAEQIRKGIRAAIESGVLARELVCPPEDLAAQVGVARGTMRSAYEKLSSAQLIVASRATGTHVADRPSFAARQEEAPDPGSFMEMYQELTAGPAIFQMGVPAHETFPAKLFARMRTQAVRAEVSAPAMYPDPRGELELRREIAAYLALAFPFARTVSSLQGCRSSPIPVDANGVDVSYGLKHAPDAALAVRNSRAAGTARIHIIAGKTFAPSRLGCSGRGVGDRG